MDRPTNAPEAGPLLQLETEDLRLLGKTGFLVRADGVPGDRCARLLADARAFAATVGLRVARMGRGARSGTDAARRGDRVAWFDPELPAVGRHGPLLDLWAGFDALRTDLNANAFLGLETFDMQVAVYPGEGERYERHLDAFHDAAASRRLTAILYVNPAWEPAHGGQLALFPPGGPVVRIPPRSGTVVVFLSDRIEHAVEPVHAERWALTAWFHGPRALPGT